MSTPDDLETSPDSEKGSPVVELSRGLLWLHPEERFLPFSAGRLTLGRDLTVSSRLNGDRVSRLHASITCQGPLHILRDERAHAQVHGPGVIP